jgi:hypothetical protein
MIWIKLKKYFDAFLKILFFQKIIRLPKNLEKIVYDDILNACVTIEIQGDVDLQILSCYYFW